MINLYRTAYFENIVSEAFGKAYPSVAIPVNFYPLENLQLGDIGTDCLVKAARILSIAPNDIMKSVFKYLPESFKNYFIIHDNFLNLHFSWNGFELSSNDLNNEACNSQKSLYILGTDIGLMQDWPKFRLKCLILFHYFLAKQLNVEVTVLWNNKELQTDFLSIKKFLFDNEEKFLLQDLENVISTVSPNSEICLWSSKVLWSSKKYEELSFDKKLTLRFPRKEWFKPCDFAVNLTGLENLIDDERKLHSLIYYFSSPLNMMELDLSTIMHNEQANMTWLLEYSLERMSQLELLSDDWSLQLGSKFDEPWRSLLARWFYLPASQQRALFDGQIFCYISILQDSLSQLNSIFNSPNYRGQLVGQSESRSSLALVGHRLVGINAILP